MLAIGNDELGGAIKDGESVKNTKTGEVYDVQFYYSDNKAMNIICIKNAIGEKVLVGIGGKLLSPWERIV